MLREESDRPDFSWLYPVTGLLCPVCGDRFNPHKFKEWHGLVCYTCWCASTPEFRDKLIERLRTVSSYSIISSEWIVEVYQKKE